MLNVLPWKQTEIILSLLRLNPGTEFRALLMTMIGYSISSRGFLSLVIDIMVIWVKFIQSSPFSWLIPKMSVFNLAISCLTTSSLPWFMDLTFQVPMQYCSLQHQTLLVSPLTPTTRCVFALAPSLHSFWSYISSSILGTYQPGEFIFQFLSFLPFHTVHGVLKARIQKCPSLLQWTTLCLNWKSVYQNIANKR